MATDVPADTGASPELRRGAVSFGGVLFQSITFMAPAIATALSIPAGIAFSGGAAPLSVILALVASLIAANSIGQLAKHLPSAGSFYTFVSHGIHPKVGFLVAWGFLLGVIVGGPFLGADGLRRRQHDERRVGLVDRHAGGSGPSWSASWSSRWATAGSPARPAQAMLLGAFEIVVFVGISLTLIVKAGGDNTLQVFGTHYANNPDYQGFSGVIAGSVFTILAFIGFEQAAPIAEEAHEPRRTVPRAIIVACLVIGLFYILNTYASSVSFGPDKMTGFVRCRRQQPVAERARTPRVGLGRLLADLPGARELGDRQPERREQLRDPDHVRDGPDPTPARGLRPAQPLRVAPAGDGCPAGVLARRGAVPRLPLRPVHRASP